MQVMILIVTMVLQVMILSVTMVPPADGMEHFPLRNQRCFALYSLRLASMRALTQELRPHNTKTHRHKRGALPGQFLIAPENSRKKHPIATLANQRGRCEGGATVPRSPLSVDLPPRLPWLPIAFSATGVMGTQSPRTRPSRGVDDVHS